MSRGTIHRCKHTSLPRPLHTSPSNVVNVPPAKPTNDEQPLHKLIYARIQRHTAPTVRRLKIGSLNIRSVNNKIDDVCDVMSKHRLHMLALTETWHEDFDCETVKRIRNLDYNLIEECRTIPSTTKRDNIQFVNRGGIAIISKPGTNVNLKVKVITFEHLCGRITLDDVSSLLVVIYRPDSQPITPKFFDDLTTLLESPCLLSLPKTIIGDLNVHIERSDDADHGRLLELMTAFGLVQHVESPTHDAGGLLVVIITTSEQAPEDVDVVDSGLSDHMLVTWSSNHTVPAPVYVKLTRRTWRKFSFDEFIRQRQTTELCKPIDPTSTVDVLCEHFNSIITEVLDELAPVKEVTRRDCRRQPWLDDETSKARKKARRLAKRLKAKKDQADASRSQRKHPTGSQKYTWQVITLVTYGAQLTTYLAKLNLELNLSFLWRITTPTSTRKSLMSGLPRHVRHRRSTLEVTYLDWTASRP